MDWFIVLNATFNNISIISWQSVLLLEETMQSVPITNKVVSSNPTQVDTTLCDEVCSDLRQVSGFYKNEEFLYRGPHNHHFLKNWVLIDAVVSQGDD
jgi:hypothetical protein